MRRDGRLSSNKKQTLEALWPIYCLENNPVDFKEIFQRSAPVILEIGFGMGQSLLQQTIQQPEYDFIGIEVHRPGVASVLTHIHKKQLTNLRIFHADAIEVLQKAIPNESLDIVQIYFPDPWPKRRHHKRRLIQPDFVNLISQKLKPGGKLLLATDWEDYAHHMLRTLEQNPNVQNIFGENQFAPREITSRLPTKFEQRGEKLGHAIWDLGFMKL